MQRHKEKASAGLAGLKKASAHAANISSEAENLAGKAAKELKRRERQQMTDDPEATALQRPQKQVIDNVANSVANMATPLKGCG